MVVFTKPYPDEPLRFFYLNDSSMVPPLLTSIETALLALETTTLLHAIATKRKGIWVGLILFGLFVEALGYFSGSHYHAQFNIQAINFLPLKELLIYQVLVYPAVVSVQQLRLNKLWHSTVVMAFVSQLANMPYDSFCVRKGFDFFKLSPAFENANFDSTTWHGGVIGVYYGWLAMGAGAGVATHVVTSHAYSGIQASLVFCLGGVMSCLFWIPFQSAKLLTCPPQQTTKDFNPQEYLTHCIREASVGDDIIWMASASCVTLLTIYILSNTSSSNKDKGHYLDWTILFVPLAYNAIIIACYAKVDTELLPLWCVNAMVACAVHWKLHHRQKSKSKVN